MHRVGVWSIRIGLFLTLAGIVLGFGLMWFGDQSIAKPFLMAIPLGFLLLFQGVVTVILFKSEGEVDNYRRSGRHDGPPP
ncbi:MAG: hypothetical protein ACK4IT_00685 [Thioalkalivibrionaceae bacterium]